MNRKETIQQIATLLEQCDQDTLDAVYTAIRNIIGPEHRKASNIFTFIARLL